MSETQKTQNPISFIDYVPAELRENKRWELIFYVPDPFSNTPTKLKRKAVRIRPLTNKTERRKLAKKMEFAYNRKLARGWNPFINENETKGFVKFTTACKLFISRSEKEVKNEEKRIDTLRTYRSFINNITNYLIEIGEGDMFAIKFNDDLVRDFLDVVYYDRDNSARTRNNYLNFIKTLSEWLIRHKYISVNPTNRIELIPEKQKQREVIPEGTLKQIFSYLENNKFNYYITCLMCYYCLIRRTELTKLKVSDIILKNGIIYVRSEVSKNKKGNPVTIPDNVIPFLVEHLKKAKQTDYLFSTNYLPGPTPLAPKRISDDWVKVRKACNLPKKYQWYSLKDTGITNYLKAGVASIYVKLQARHHSIVQTEAYMPKEILKANEDIKSVCI